MKVPEALRQRLVGLDERVMGLSEDLDLAEAVRDECRRAIVLIEAAADDVAPAVAADATARSSRRTRAAVLAAIEDAVGAAGEGGTTLEQIAKTTRMKRSRLDPHVARLVKAKKCVVEGDQIMLNRNLRKSLFSDAAK